MLPLTIQSPCDAPWNDMRRDGKSRFCAPCQKRVFDVEALTERQLRGLALVTGGRFCAQQRIVGGELVLQPAPAPARTRAGRIAWAVRVVATASALGSAACSVSDALAAPPPASLLEGLAPSTDARPAGSTPATAPLPAAVTARDGERLRGRVAPDPRFATRVLFAERKASLDGAATATLADAVAFLAAHPEVGTVTLIGHADAAEGTTPEIEALAQARADAVKTALVQAGIGASRLTTTSYGARAPATDGATAEQRAQNRRVTFTIL